MMSGPDKDTIPFVSVVVPALNCAGDVDAFASAIRQQSYPPDYFEVIVADNGSSDETVSRLQANAIRYVVRAERGRSRALNAGLQVARGDIICTTDISCRPHRNWIREIVDCFEDPTVGCVAGEIVMQPTHDNLALRFQERNNYMSAMHAASRRSLPFLPFADGANASFRRAVFEAIGCFDESFFKSADVEICYRMLVETTYKIVFCRGAMVAEAGEPTLRALLKQRFRMGMSWHLMKAKYPEFYRDTLSPNGFRRIYWDFARSIGKLLVRPRGRVKMKERLEDALVRVLMSWSQSLGNHYGRYYLERQDLRPTAVQPNRLQRFIEGIAALQERVLIR